MLAETVIGAGEIALASTPAGIFAAPMHLFLLGAALGVLDADIAFATYTYRVSQNPDTYQEIEWMPPWGL